MKKTLQEIAIEKGKTLLIEESFISVKKEQIKEFEQKKMVESSNNQQFEAIAILENVEVSKYTKNKNNRYYPKPEWDRVNEENQGEGSYSLDGHIEDGNTGNVVGIWHNLKPLAENVVADLYLIEEKPLKILKAGGRLGTSSVGYGNLEEDGRVYDFELDRIADIVLDPSQGTFASITNLKEKTNTIEEANTNKTIKESIIIKKEEKTMKEKLETANFKNHVYAVIQESKEKENLFEAISRLKTIVVPEGEGMEIIESEIKTEINNLQVKLEEQKKDSEGQLEEKINKIKELETIKEESDNKIKELTEKLETASEVMKKTGNVEDVEVLKENENKMVGDIKILIEDTKLRDNDLSILKEDTELRDNDISILKEDLEKATKDVDVLVEELKNAENTIKIYEAKLEEKGFKFDEADDKKEDDKKDDKKKDKKDDEDEEIDGKEKEEDGKDEKKESNIKKISEIEKIYESKVKEIPSLENIKEEILKSESAYEAVKQITEFKEDFQKDEMIKIDSVSKPSGNERPGWLGNRL